MDESWRQLFDTEEVVARRSRPGDGPALDHLLRTKQIVRVLPGIYAQAGQQVAPEVRMAALKLWEPKAVLTHDAAARCFRWPTGDLTEITAAVPRTPPRAPGFRLVRRRLPDDLTTTVDGVRVTSRALTALDLGAEAIDRALLTGEITVDDLRLVLDAIPRHRGNADKRLLLAESSGTPWSSAERELHRLLRQAGIQGWQANVTLRTSDDEQTVDILFRAERLVIEVDGKHYHGDATFERDRWKQNALVLDGWRVLRFTWNMIEKYPDRVLSAVQKGLRPLRAAG